MSDNKDIELWHNWRSGPHVLQLPSLPRDPYGRTVYGVGVSSDGKRGAVVAAEEVLVFDVGGGLVRVPAPPPLGSIEPGPLRAEHGSLSWAHPLPHDRVLVVDFCRRSGHFDEATDDSYERCEVVVELFDITTKEKLASENVVFRADTDRGLGEHIAICDDGVLLNRERIVEVVR